MTLNTTVDKVGHKLLSSNTSYSALSEMLLNKCPTYQSQRPRKSRGTFSGSKRPAPHHGPRIFAKRPVKKSVTFSEFASVVVRTMPREEIKDRWLQPSEYAEIERRRRDTVYAVMETKGDLTHLDEHEHCLKGLEHQLSPQQCARRRDTNMRYRQLLLEEQGFQMKCGFRDPETLRRLSEAFSRQSMTQARIRALIN
ncbi:hypothetical protein ACA910_007838 [Epithemia clementina (nom. ined.)]